MEAYSIHLIHDIKVLPSSGCFFTSIVPFLFSLALITCSGICSLEKGKSSSTDLISFHTLSHKVTSFLRFFFLLSFLRSPDLVLRNYFMGLDGVCILCTQSNIQQPWEWEKNMEDYKFLQRNVWKVLINLIILRWTENSW